MSGTKKLKIGFLTSSLDNNINKGPNLVLYHLIRSLQQHCKDEMEIFLFHQKCQQSQAADIYAASNEILLPGNFSWAFHLYFRVKKLCLDGFVYNTTPVENILFYGFPCKKFVLVHGDVKFIMPHLMPFKQRYIDRWAILLYKKLGLLNRVDHYFAVSGTLRQSIMKIYNLPAGKISISYNGYDESVFNDRSGPADEAVLKRYHLHEKEYILHVNNFNEKKNPQTLIKSYLAFLSGGAAGFPLVIAGAGWEKDRLIAIAREANLDPPGPGQLILTGPLPQPTLASLYRHALVFLNPTRHETFGMTNLEAIACGCPVITTNRYSIPEIVNGGAMLIDDPDDYIAFARALRTLTSDSRLRQQFIEKGKNHIQQFRWQTIARKFCNKLQTLIQP